MKTQFTPIAMRCTKEQFKAIKRKLKGKVKIAKDVFRWYNDEENYLTNHFNDEIEVKFTTIKNGRKFYETWDEATFLKACGIEIDTYTVSKDFILEAHESACSTWKTKIENKFPELFPKVELELNKWYKNKKWEGSLFFYDGETNKENGSHCGYGFTYNHEWVDFSKNGNWNINDGYELATKEEVETSLIAEAKKRGLLNKGVMVKSAYSQIKETINGLNLKYSELENSLYSNYGVKDSICLFHNGKWAEIISEPIELSLDEIAEKFNVDVSLIKIKK